MLSILISKVHRLRGSHSISSTTLLDNQDTRSLLVVSHLSSSSHYDLIQSSRRLQALVYNVCTSSVQADHHIRYRYFNLVNAHCGILAKQRVCHRLPGLPRSLHLVCTSSCSSISIPIPDNPILGLIIGSCLSRSFSTRLDW